MALWGQSQWGATQNAGVAGGEEPWRLARGEGDAYSDLDLMIEAVPERWPELWAEGRLLAATAGEVVLHIDHQWSDMKRELWYAGILRSGLYLDLAYRRGQLPLEPGHLCVFQRPGISAPAEPAAEPATRQPDRLEDLFGLFWGGTALCAKYTLRGDLWQCLEFMASRRDMILRAWRIVHAPERVDWGWHTARKDLPAAVLDRLTRAVPHLDPVEIIEALMVTTDLMAELGPELAAARGVTHPSPEGIRQLVADAAATLKARR